MNVFVYGTLMLPEITSALTGKIFEMKDAILHDYAIFSVLDPNRTKKGPVIFKKPGSLVRGKLLLDVDQISLKIFDRFESGFRRIAVNVVTDDGPQEAQMYESEEVNKEHLKLGWRLDEFKDRHLEDYLNRIHKGDY